MTLTVRDERDRRGDPRERPDLAAATDAYAGRFEGGAGRYFLEVQERAVLEAVGRAGGARSVLDVGGGHAQVALVLDGAGCEVSVLGSDRSAFRPSLLAGRSCRLQVGDLLRLPYADRAFDVALSLRTMAHLNGWGRLISELCRVSRRGVIVDYPSRRGAQAVSRWLFPLKRRIERDTRPFRLFSERDIAREFRSCGFEIAATWPQFFFPMVMYRAVGSEAFARAVEGAASRIGLTRRLGSPVVALATPQEGGDRGRVDGRGRDADAGGGRP